MRTEYALLREFKTKNFRVVADWTYDYDTDLSWDEDGETRANLESGEYTAMEVRVRVLHKALGELGRDYLGGCIHKTPDEFMDHKECARYTRELRARNDNAVCGSYFADMIAEAIAEARKSLVSAKRIYVRQEVQS